MALIIGGVQLITLGGSPGYALLAIPLLTAGVLLLLRRRSALLAYAIVITASLIWAIQEVGFDWWAMAPREGVIVLLGLLLLLPPVTRTLRTQTGHPAGYGVAGGSLVGALLIAGVVAAISFFSQPHEIDGFMPADRMAVPLGPRDNVAPGDWTAYGRTSAGQRYSPLDEITAQNVKNLEKVWEYHAGDIHPVLPGSAVEATPLIVNDTMFVCTPRSEVIALDPVTGEQRWRFDPELVELPLALARYTTCRGVSYHDDGVANPDPMDAPDADAAQAKALVAASRANATTLAAGVSHNIRCRHRCRRRTQPGDSRHHRGRQNPAAA